MNQPTKEYITSLQNLKEGDLIKLRTYIGKELSTSVECFDLFSGIWWTLREKSSEAPRREVAFLVMKLFAVYSHIEHKSGNTLPAQLRICEPRDVRAALRFQKRFDSLLASTLNSVESHLVWALQNISTLNKPSIDWEQLTEDLTAWDKEQVQSKWAKDYLFNKQLQNS